MSKDISIFDFEQRFPTDQACLAFLFNEQFAGKPCPSCKGQTKFYPVRKRRCYECGKCGHQIFPMIGTVAEGSKIPLRKWFYAQYYFAQEKNSLSARKLSRDLGIAYKTALSMVHKLKSKMNESLQTKMDSVVEIDETLIGGKCGKKKGNKNPIGFNGQKNKTTVFGMLQRNGFVKTRVVKRRSGKVLLPIIQANVKIGTTIYSDEYAPYKKLTKLGYNHGIIHHNAYRWSYGEISTNGIEGYWSHIKRSIRGVHRHVSKQHLQKYLNGFDFIYNRRYVGTQSIFNDLINLMFFPSG